MARRITRARARGLHLVSQVLLVVQLLSLGHLLSVRHVTCPEHGDIVHVDAPEISSDQPAPDQDATTALQVGAASASTVGADHAHCLACVDASRRCLLTGPAPLSSHHAPVIGQAPAASPAFVAPIELLLLSPKNSPPSA